MSLSSNSAERAKYGYLLQLAQDQIFALESEDFFAFDRVLAAKRTLIESLVGGADFIRTDPALSSIVAQIEDRDQAAQRLLYRKIGRVMREMAEIQQHKKAGRAYRRPASSCIPTVHPISPDAPQFLDRAS